MTERSFVRSFFPPNNEQVHEPKKSFYKKFLYEPFPVESSLPGALADHLNAEVVSGEWCREGLPSEIRGASAAAVARGELPQVFNRAASIASSMQAPSRARRTRWTTSPGPSSSGAHSAHSGRSRRSPGRPPPARWSAGAHPTCLSPCLHLHHAQTECRRLLQNPSYYDLDSTEPEAVSAYLSALVEGVLAQLQDAGCLEVRLPCVPPCVAVWAHAFHRAGAEATRVSSDRHRLPLALPQMDEATGEVAGLTMGRIASSYYMRHQTMATFAQRLGPGMSVQASARI